MSGSLFPSLHVEGVDEGIGQDGACCSGQCITPWWKRRLSCFCGHGQMVAAVDRSAVSDREAGPRFAGSGDKLGFSESLLIRFSTCW